MRQVVQIPTRTVRLLVTRYDPDNAVRGFFIFCINGVALFFLYAGEFTPLVKIISGVFLVFAAFHAAMLGRHFIVCDHFVSLNDKEALSIDVLEEISDKAEKSK